MHEHKSERQARDFIEVTPNKFHPELSNVDVHGADVTVLLPREIPTGLLESAEGRADLRIEGIRDDGKVEAVLKF